MLTGCLSIKYKLPEEKVKRKSFTVDGFRPRYFNNVDIKMAKDSGVILL